jgi:regulator of replication initiation timing
VELLINDKKRWMKEKKEMRHQLVDLAEHNELLALKNKHLQEAILRMATYDQMDFSIDTKDPDGHLPLPPAQDPNLHL